MSHSGFDDILQLFSANNSPEDLLLAGLQGIISAQITMKREALKMNQKEFASFMGVSQGLVSRWEKGECNFTLRSLIHIASKLGLEIQCPFKLSSPPVYYSNTDKVVQIGNPDNPYAASSYAEPSEYATVIAK